LYLSLIFAAFGADTATLVVRVFLRLRGVPAEESAVAAPGRRGWMMWNSVSVRGWVDLVPFISFLVMSAGGGIAVGCIRLRDRRQPFFTSLLVAYVGSILAALSLDSTQAPQLPLVEIEADKVTGHDCSEVPVENLFWPWKMFLRIE
jgi:hypothetical protein